MELIKIYQKLSAQLSELDASYSVTEFAPRREGGLAAMAALALTGEPSPGTSVSSAAEDITFEGSSAETHQCTWEGHEIVTIFTGMQARGAGLIEGMRAYACEGGGCLAIIVDELIRGDIDDISYVSSININFILGLGLAEQARRDVFVMSLSASLNYSAPAPAIHFENNTAQVTLSGVYPDIIANSFVIIEYNGKVSVALATKNLVGNVVLDGGVITPASIVFLDYASILQGVNEDFDKNIRIWYNPRKAGTLERLPTLTVTPADILAAPRRVTLADPKQGLLPAEDTPFILRDADGNARRAVGRGVYDAQQNPQIQITAIELEDGDDALELTKPITFYWGLSTVTAGKTVTREVLGSGDASRGFQRFTLAQSPLTYVVDPDAPGGRRPELTVYVDDVAWRRVTSFYGTKPDDRVYLIRHDRDDATHIIFGDGELGARLPTGSSNVVASYRFGVGGNVEANAIDRLLRPIPGVDDVFNPLPATGGEDPPDDREARERGIESTRVLGKLVSLPDFEVEAARWGGVLQARARWVWNPAADTAMVALWILYPQIGDPSPALRAYLQALAEPGTHVAIHKAKPRRGELVIELEIEPGYLPDTVAAAVEDALYDDFDGLLAPRNASIGGVFRRSVLHHAIHQIEGVSGVTSVRFAGAALPRFLPLDPGEYFAPTAPAKP